MPTTLKMNELSIQEKIQIMENLWVELSKNANDVESPQWHNDVLQDRENNLKNGNDQFIDWNTAKDNIRKSIS
jgi:putative addiction module component (TIGR02574 family)